MKNRKPRLSISIHAPERGATVSGVPVVTVPIYFNPRPRAGSDGIFKDHIGYRWISIHAPERGATGSSRPHLRRCSHFNPRPRAGSDVSGVPVVTVPIYFNPRPRAGSDASVERSKLTGSDFNPRPRAGSDASSEWISGVPEKFQSTPPSGERHIRIVDNLPASAFQSTPPSGERPYAQRDIDFTEYERMYLMKFPEGVQWRDWKNEASCRPTLSPSARNKIDGALRLLLSQQPIFHVESQKEDLDDEKIEEIENSLARCWELSSTIGGKQTHYNMMLSALLYDEMHTAITPTAELASKNKKDMRIKRIAERTPLLFESWNPHQGYPEFDTFGLCFYYRETQEDWRSVKNKYADILDGKFDNMRYGNATVSIAYDLDYFGVWIDRQCVYLEEHGLSAIPVDVTLVNGSSFFDKPEEQRQPMLYSIHKSKLWERESAMLTVMYTQMFSLGLAPMFVHRSKTGDPLNITMNTNGIQTIQLEEGESFDIISSKGIIPPISIHAPERGATILGRHPSCLPVHFNPRPRAGSDSFPERWERSACVFQSTPPSGERHHNHR